MNTIHKYFVNHQNNNGGQPPTMAQPMGQPMGQGMGQGMSSPQPNPQASPVHFQESDFKSAQPEEKPNYTLKL